MDENIYHIIHIEDDTELRQAVAYEAHQHGKEYLWVGSLQALQDCLPDCWARVFVVDACFPRAEGAPVELLADEAIRLIRSRHKDPHIVLYSKSSHRTEIAQRNNVKDISQEVQVKGLIPTLEREIATDQENLRDQMLFLK